MLQMLERLSLVQLFDELQVILQVSDFIVASSLTSCLVQDS